MCDWAGRIRQNLAVLAVLAVFPAILGAGFQDSGSFLMAGVVNGTVDVDGRRVRYAYHFDLNAFIDAVRVGDAVIAVTRSGNLLRLNARTLSLEARAVVTERATAITKDERGVVLIGTEIGGIAVVDPVSLAPTVLVSGDGSVRWLTRTGDRLVAVLEPRQISRWPGEPLDEFRRRLTQGRWSLLVHERGRTLRHQLPRDTSANAFLVDGSTLWLGMDGGEFGGALASIDLRTGRVTSRDKSGLNVYGLVRAADGRLLAHGGLAHITISEGYVAGIDARGQLQPIRTFEDPPTAALRRDKADVRLPDRTVPQAPIDLLVEDHSGEWFWAVSNHELFRVTPDLKTWSKWADLGGRLIEGRANSVGNTTTVNKLVPGSDGDLLAFTGRDGVLRVSGRDVQRIAVPDQLEGHVVDIWDTSLGTIYLDADMALSSDAPFFWRLSNDRWQRIDFCPTENKAVGFYSMPIASDESGVLVHCQGDTGDTPAALVRLDAKGRLLTLDSWRFDYSTPDRFIPTGGRLVALKRFDASGDAGVWTREGGEWRMVGRTSLKHPLDTTLGREGRSYVSLAAPGAILQAYWAPAEGVLIRLVSELKSGALRPEPVPGRELTNIMDAVPDRGANALLVTPRGLFRYSLANTLDGPRGMESRRAERIESPKGERIVTVARDGTGRLWAAGDRLYISSNEGKTWRVVDAPMMSRTEVKRLRPKVGTKQGMLLSLYDRGFVVFEEE